MKKLKYQARDLLGKNWSLAKLTRQDMLKHIDLFTDFCERRYGLQYIKNLSKIHIDNYISYLKNEGISHGTIANRLVTIRKIARGIGKPNIVYRTNKEYGISRERHRPIVLDYCSMLMVLATLKEKANKENRKGRIALMAVSSVHLIIAFGLRLKESLMSHEVVNGFLLVEGAKGGRPRAIKIDTDSKREAIQLLRQTSIALGSQTGRIMPPEITLKQAIGCLARCWRRYGGSRDARTNMHAIRHFYAQSRLKQGHWPRRVSAELGHGRIGVLKHYALPTDR